MGNCLPKELAYAELRGNNLDATEIIKKYAKLFH